MKACWLRWGRTWPAAAGSLPYTDMRATNSPGSLLAALGEKIPVTAAIANSTGDRLTGLDITEKRIELFLDLGLEDYTVTAESYGNIGFGPENTEQRASVHLMGTNTVSAMDAWKPEPPISHTWV